jgi:tRNA/tmRNA/rRNA uracil-C5-methylase (TrmA/RlmC/RlmD family)
VVAIESDDRAVADLNRNLRRARLADVTVVADRVEDNLARFAVPRPDAVVLDPPRSGLPPGVADTLAGLGAGRIAYLSCDPATLARDLARIAAGGYVLRSVEGFDLFPQTPHVEALALLERR